MGATVRQKWIRSKVQSDAISMVHFPRTGGPDLHLEVGPGGRRTSIEEALRRAIRDGRLATGTRVPSSRVLARDLCVARGTVTEAYDQLVAEGWLAARQGSGTVVAWAGDHRSNGRAAARTTAVPRCDTTSARAARTSRRFLAMSGWRPCARACERMPDTDLRYGDPRGLLSTREALSGYLARARGVRADPDRLVICSGFVQALALLTSTLRRQGATVVAMENPCMNAYRTVTARAELSIRFLDVDEDGADPTPLVRARASGSPGWGDVAAVLLTPAHQYPTGTTLAPDRRAAFVDWARHHGRIVIEDDYDGEHRYDRQPVGALQGMDADHVVYVGTASKSLAPGLRLGWMVLPDDLVEPVATAKELADRQSGVIEQAALAELINSGGLDRHIRRNRLRYRRRRDELVAALGTVPAIGVRGIAAGLHAVVDLPEDGPTEAEVVASLAAERGRGARAQRLLAPAAPAAARHRRRLRDPGRARVPGRAGRVDRRVAAGRGRLAPMRIAVVGGTGLVGRHVVDAFVTTDVDVVVVSQGERRRPHDRGRPGPGAGRRAAHHRREQRADDRRGEGDGVLHCRRRSSCRPRRHERMPTGSCCCRSSASTASPSGYYAAKLAHEEATKAGEVPTVVLRSTQFHEFAGQVLTWDRDGEVSRVPEMLVQPVAAESIAAELVELALAESPSATADVGGPLVEQLVDLATGLAARRGEPRAGRGPPRRHGAGRAAGRRRTAAGPGRPPHRADVRGVVGRRRALAPPALVTEGSCIDHLAVLAPAARRCCHPGCSRTAGAS